MNNMVFFHYMRKGSGKVRSLDSLMHEIWDYCQRMIVHIVPHYVPSKEDPADVWSKQNITLAEASMDPRTMAIVCRKFSLITSAKDWMANAEKAQCPRYIFDCPQPGAWGVDLFTHRPHKVSPGHCNPPWRLIPRVIKYLEQAKRYNVIPVVPMHPHRPWWHRF